MTEPRTTITQRLPSQSYRGETHQICCFSSHKSKFVLSWQLQMEMGDNHLSEREGIRSALLSTYCVGNLLCYDKQCADVFSVCISFSVWAAACRSLLLCVGLTLKKKHTRHTWLIEFPQWLMHSCRDIRQVWSGFDVIRRFQYLPNDCCHFSPLNNTPQSSLSSQFNWFKNQSRHREWDGLKKKKKKLRGTFCPDPGLVIVSDFFWLSNRRRPPFLRWCFLGEMSTGSW